MKITKDNYEAFFIDYLDGNLKESLVNEFIEFLQNNPDLKEELQIAGSVILEPEKIAFKGKKKLYKEKYDLQHEFDRAAIARLEGDLSEEEHASFKKYLSTHPDRQGEISLFATTKLKADDAIKFPGKSRLYRQTAGKTLFLWTTRAAAVILLALLAYFFADEIRKEPGFPATITESRDKNEKTEPVTVPEKPDKQDEPAQAKEKIAPPVNNTESYSQPLKSPRESAIRQKQQEDIAETRKPAEVPERINSRQASFTLEPQVIALAEVNQPSAIQTVNDYEYYEERMLGDIVKEKTGLADLSVSKLVKAGLGLVSIVSKDKFTFETNSAGEITEFSYDSRLLAISIPTKND